MRIVSLVKWSLVLLMFVVAMPAVSAQTPPPANETATEFYMRYLTAFGKAKKMEELLPFMTAARVKEFNTMPADMKGGMLEMIKMMSATNIKVTKEEKTPKGATLSAEGVDGDKKKQMGTIAVVKEGGLWKLEKEDWHN